MHRTFSVGLPRLRLAMTLFFVILSVGEISHRTIAPPDKLSLRGSIATAAISREGGGLRSICSVLFQGDRHACARDDILFLLVIAKERSDCGNPLE